ncbi:40S ribosomal protein S17 [Takifugu flavidus]|uniref:40S ribosomal protein S17 n=1 Tax=Takifugu flavidus TaxID=433684 RepID=A0A5C6P7I7_9TELE|nr:40S ribosomal protein S17 [Takifugu flavidus]
MCLFYQSLRPGQHGTSQDWDGRGSRLVHHLECFIPLGSNSRSNERACEIPTRKLAKKIAGYVTQLKRIQRGPVRVIPIKLQEEESEEGQLRSFVAVFLPMILYSMCDSPSELFTDYLQAQK